MGNETVEKIIRRNFPRVSPYTPLKELILRFRDSGCRALPVVDEDKLLGIVSLKDLYKAFFYTEQAFFAKMMRLYREDIECDIFDTPLTPEMAFLISAEDLMEFNPIRVSPDCEIKEAFRLINVHELSFLPVVEGEKLVGVVTPFDIMLYVLELKGVL